MNGSFGKPRINGWIGIAALLALSACEREKRLYDTPPSAADAASVVQVGPIHAGPAAPAPDASAAASAASAGFTVAMAHNPYESNAYAVSQGKKFYRWYNCNGCHASGGGGMGPPLMDDQWIYGHAPAQIVATILQGRPNGMPAFAGRIPEDQVWQIAAYVLSMSGQLRTDVAPSRSDSLSAGAAENRRDKEAAVTATPPKEH
jgi:cytochrome c oxidase cbb3-type subunit 3